MYSGEWVTAKGERLLISGMESRHLVNCIRLIQRKRGWRRHLLSALQLELEIRGLNMRSMG